MTQTFKRAACYRFHISLIIQVTQFFLKLQQLLHAIVDIIIIHLSPPGPLNTVAKRIKKKK